MTNVMEYVPLSVVSSVELAVMENAAPGLEGTEFSTILPLVSTVPASS